MRTDPFRNPADVGAHEETTGPELLEQTGGRVGTFVAGAGTGGTSFAMVHRLVREEGLFVGGSSGNAVVAALRVAGSGLVTEPVVALLADSWDRYLSKPWMAATA